MSKTALFIYLTFVLAIASPQAQYRTVSDKEVASWFETPDFPWTDLGAYIGTPGSTLAPDAIRGIMGHFDKFYSGEDSLAVGFPYSKLRAYEAQQVAAGKPPIFLTATYLGKSRPVLWSWSLALVNNQPTASPDQWQYGVNVGDSRFIHFWINHYAESLMATYQWPWEGLGPYLWLQLDQCAFEYSLWGVLDDNGNYVAGVPWDSPFPANQAAYETGIETFFSQVKALAPNVNLAANIGSQVDPTHFPQLFANVGGGLTENIYGWHLTPDAGTRTAWYEGIFQWFPWLASQSRMAIIRANLLPNDSIGLLNSFVVYSLIKGPNFFFAPGYNTSPGSNPPPSLWAGMRAQLGSPLSGFTASSPTSAGTGYRLFSRNFEGGTAYLNWTGITQSIALNPLVTYYDPNGNPITSHQIQLADAAATYVTTTPQALPAPSISPRSSFSYVGPLSVTMESSTTGASIHYTLDGSTPTTSSPLYTSPVRLTSSAVVNAKAFLNSQSSFSRHCLLHHLLLFLLNGRVSCAVRQWSGGEATIRS